MESVPPSVLFTKQQLQQFSPYSSTYLTYCNSNTNIYINFLGCDYYI